jgi:hypothetical protein
MRLSQVGLGMALVVAVAAPAASARGEQSQRTIDMVGRATGIQLVDVMRTGKPTAGNSEIGKTVLLDESGATIGHSVVNCTILDKAGTQFLCTGYNQLRGGDLVLAGHFSALSKTYRLAIVGGTGDYAGARGWEQGTWLDAKFTKLRIRDTFTG